MAARADCTLLPLFFIALARVILVDATCGDKPIQTNHSRYFRSGPYRLLEVLIVESRAYKIPTIQSECEDGEHLDSHARKCSSTAPCMTLCKNVVDENGCIDPYTCQETGFFPKCKTQCLREYYHCVEVNDDYAPTETCSDDLVFNPDTLQCTKTESCPYSHQYVPRGPVPA
ncbi:uncharacterized protein LOC123505010 [Portunus trituberculatus]|uniref:uncharacterized protein LOC123505010 n=1 Tax=Portunus trituberculatus TaxID=210409 RepID=UPI001E1D1CD6|nr:uncharacterized protein LOC123505010 [Portunus trituberculatus]